jgi:hypothetical protein
MLIPEDTKADSFTEFARATEQRLRVALCAALGPERGREAAADALAYGWEHWDRISEMDNMSSLCCTATSGQCQK